MELARKVTQDYCSQSYPCWWDPNDTCKSELFLIMTKIMFLPKKEKRQRP